MTKVWISYVCFHEQTHKYCLSTYAEALILPLLAASAKATV